MSPKAPSYRLYHAALLRYVSESSEPALAHAYELGRNAMYGGNGLLHILNLHEKSITAILDSTRRDDEFRWRINSSIKFLVEALSPFEMACHGYFALLERTSGKVRQREPLHARLHDRR